MPHQTPLTVKRPGEDAIVQHVGMDVVGPPLAARG